MDQSSLIDFESDTSNMYGCQPCPKCHTSKRVSYRRKEDLSIECDDCGFKETGYSKELEDLE